MTRPCSLFALAATSAALTLTSIPAHACGGFACDGSGVAQTGERLLFAVDTAADETTMVVEVQYGGSPTAFAWILPVPADVDLDDVGTVPSGFFNDLEGATAPLFTEFASGDSASGSSSFSCFGPSQVRSSSGAASGSDGEDGPSSSEVNLLGEVTLGAFEVDLIASADGGDLEDWLVDNGYVLPAGFEEAVAPYVAAQMRFLGLRLDPDASAGVLDAVTITMNGTTPSIPLVLTSISATTNMEIIAYVVANDRFRPLGWTDLDFDWSSVELTTSEWDGLAYSNYPVLLEETVEAAGGRAFVTEFAGPTADLVDLTSAPGPWLAQGDYVTRLRTYVDPDDMNTDPSFGPIYGRGDQSNEHRVFPNLDERTAGLGLLVLLLAVRRRRSEGDPTSS